MRICAWIETSSAETGSSQTMSSWIQGERAGDADALALAARELVRVTVDEVGVEADDFEQLLDRPAPSPPVADLVDEEWLPDDVADRHPRIERGVRVLEDDLHLPPHLRSSLRGIVVNSSPSKRTEPEVGFRSSSTQ